MHPKFFLDSNRLMPLREVLVISLMKKLMMRLVLSQTKTLSLLGSVFIKYFKKMEKVLILNVFIKSSQEQKVGLKKCKNLIQLMLTQIQKWLILFFHRKFQFKKENRLSLVLDLQLEKISFAKLIQDMEVKITKD